MTEPIVSQLNNAGKSPVSKPYIGPPLLTLRLPATVVPARLGATALVALDGSHAGFYHPIPVPEDMVREGFDWQGMHDKVECILDDLCFQLKQGYATHGRYPVSIAFNGELVVLQYADEQQ